MPRISLLALGACILFVMSLSGTLVSGDEPVKESAGEVTPMILTRDDIPQTQAEATATADTLEQKIEVGRRSESVRMFLSIARGSMVGSKDGWFGPARSKFGFESLAHRWGPPTEGGFQLDSLSDPSEWLARLDRNHDGRITADDLDWSDENSWVQQSYLANRFFRRINTSGDGKLSAEEWQAFFDQARGDEESVSYEAFRDALIGGSPTGGFRPGDAPTMEILLKGLASGEIGSLQEGPHPGEVAPDFTLPTLDGTGPISLSSLVGDKPTVQV